MLIFVSTYGDILIFFFSISLRFFLFFCFEKMPLKYLVFFFQKKKKIAMILDMVLWRLIEL